MSAEFNCCECGRLTIAVALRSAPHPPLCQACVQVPGWFRHPDERRTIDPGHSGREIVDCLPERRWHFQSKG